MGRGGDRRIAMNILRVVKWGVGIAAAAVVLAYLGLLPLHWVLSPEQVATVQGTLKRTPKKAEPKRMPPAPVSAALVAQTDMPVIISAPATVEPLANVAVKTRTDGQIVEVLFKEGDAVNAGDVMFRLDDRLVRAQILQAEAQIQRDQASLKDAEGTLTRRESLIANRVVTEAALEQARYAVQGLKASIEVSKALLESQRTQLDYLTIRAPIGGRTGSLNAKVGATVRGIDSSPLVTINQTKPILVTFPVPQSQLPALRKALADGAKAEIMVPGSPVKATGKIAFIDNQVDKTTGAIVVKVEALNADEVLWPGLAVEVALTVDVRPGMAAVPASAVLPSQLGMMTWVIGADNKVATRPVKVAAIVGQTVFLSEGLKPGERVVTDGQIRLAPGAVVSVGGEAPKAPPKPAQADNAGSKGSG
jgi:multidrug efflux system membrane fusion protein